MAHPRTTLLCDRHMAAWQRRELSVAPGNLLGRSSFEQLQRRLDAALEYAATLPPRFQPEILALLVSAEGNGGHGSCRGLVHSDGPHGTAAEWAGFEEVLDGLCAASGARWSASARTWDHIISLDLL